MNASDLLTWDHLRKFPLAGLTLLDFRLTDGYIAESIF
jgi:hypothetical protein